MGNPLVAQGTLNRIRGSIIFNDHPELNVTAPNLGKEGISLAFDGPYTVQLDQMTGAVQSPEPYVPCTFTATLLKTQALSSAFKAQAELSTLLGDATLRPDAAALGIYPLTNCAIDGVREITFNGTTAGWVVTMKGYYSINSALWDT